MEEVKAKIDREKAKKARLDQSSQTTTPQSSTTATPASPLVASSKPSTEAPSSGETAVQRTVSVEADVQTSDVTKTEVKTENATISLSINVNIQRDGKAIASEEVVSDVKSSEKKAKIEEPISKVEELEESCDTGEPMEVEHCSGSHAPMETEEAVSSSSGNSEANKGNTISSHNCTYEMMAQSWTSNDSVLVLLTPSLTAILFDQLCFKF